MQAQHLLNTNAYGQCDNVIRVDGQGGCDDAEGDDRDGCAGGDVDDFGERDGDGGDGDDGGDDDFRNAAG